MMKHGNKLLYLAVFCALVIPLMVAGIADAKYLSDGAVQNAATGAWQLPADLGVCVTGINIDNSLAVGSETSRPDCIAHTFPAYTTAAACGNPANADGAHFYGKTCVDGSGNGISLKGKDRNATECTAAGGTWKDACAASWMFTGTGFCYAAVDVTATYGDQASCEAVGGNSWKTKGSSIGSCVFSFGIGGGLNGATDRSTQNWVAVKNLAGGTTLGAHLGNIPDLTAAPYNTQGGCVEAGFGWNTYIDNTGTATMGAATVATVSGSGNDACVRCHNTVSQYNGTASRWVGDTFMKTGHKKMLRKVKPGTPLLGPDDVAMGYDSSNNPINWTTGQVNISGTNYDLVWLYGDWIDAADPVYGHRGRAVYKNPDPTTAGSYSCGRCHATGWSSDSTLKSTKEPELSFSGITRITTADNVNKINLAGGITGFSAEKMSSWDQWGIQCSRCHGANDLSTPGMVDTERKKWTPTLGDVKLNTHDAAMTGPNVASICMECHRQEAGGLPYTWVGTNNGTPFNKGVGNDPSTVLVGDAHGHPGVISHPAGNQFLNSPHGKFTGTWADINTQANYASKFMNNPASDNQAACMGCHNIHESLAVADHTEPFENECTTCHTDKVITDMRHPLGAGTPAGLSGGVAAVSCEICHMPEGLHLFRINTSASYSLFPHTTYAANAYEKANTAPDGAYAQASWVDLDLACGQCHGGGSSEATNPPKTGLPYYSKATLAAFAAGIHQGASTNTAPAAAISGLAQTGYTVSFMDASSDAETAQASLVVTVRWGDGGFSTGNGGGSFSHTYATVGTFPILLTVQDAGGLTSIATASVSVPVKGSISGTVFQQDGTTGFDGVNVYLKQNGITKQLKQTAFGGAYTFENVIPGNYKVQVYKTGMVFDNDVALAGVQNPIDVTVGSTNVTRNFTRVATTITVNTSPALDNVTIYLKQNGVVKANAKTDGAGTAVFTVVPGSYQVQANKAGFNFDGDSVAAGNQNPVTVNATVNATVTFTR